MPDDDIQEIKNGVYAYAELLDTGDLAGLGQLFSRTRWCGCRGFMISCAEPMRYVGSSSRRCSSTTASREPSM